MPSGLLKRVGAATACFAAALAAQETTLPLPTAPKFEIVSIRVVPPNTPPTFRPAGFTPFLAGGQYVNSRAGLFEMISSAFGLRNPLIQLVGLPDWAKEQSYSIAAKPAQGFPDLTRAENEKQVRLMVRAMLADRFHLRYHTEIRQDKVLKLEVVKGGTKLQAVDPPVPPEVAGRVSMALGSSEVRMVGKKSTMADLAASLTIFFKQQVVDQTGSKDYYNIDVDWREPAQPDGPDAGFGPQGAALLVSVLREKLGLRLTSGTGPVEYLVVDHVEAPTDN